MPPEGLFEGERGPGPAAAWFWSNAQPSATAISGPCEVRAHLWPCLSLRRRVGRPTLLGLGLRLSQQRADAGALRRVACCCRCIHSLLAGPQRLAEDSVQLDGGPVDLLRLIAV